MMKMMILAPRKPSMTHAEFRNYLTQVHAPLVKSVTEVADDIRLYHYNFPLAQQHDPLLAAPAASHLDVVTEALFDSRAAQIANMARPRYLAEVRPDEGRFANESGAVMHYTHEIALLPGVRGASKRFWFRRRHPALSRGEFQSRWRCAVTELIASYPALRANVSRYVQNHPFPAEQHPPGMGERSFDLIDQFDYASEDAENLLAAESALWADLRALERELGDPAQTLTLRCETIPNIG